MSHSKLNEYRASVRNEAGKHNGLMIFELHNHDIFEFPCEGEWKAFEAWAAKQKKVTAIENGDVTCRVAIKYDKHRLKK